MPKVTLDAGHNAVSNVSPVDKRYIEGERMWKLGCFLKDALEDYGIDVVLTRNKVTDDPSLEARGKMAATTKSDLFISLHSNAPMAYYFDSDGDGENDTAEYDTSITGTEVFYSLTNPKNKVLADRLGAAISKKMNHNFRGSFIKQYSEDRPTWDWFGVIRNAAQNGCKAAFLIEHGFHTCPADIAYLMSDEKLAELAYEEARVIAEYFGVSKKLYRVQVGAFSNKKNAEAYCERIRKDGYSAFIVEVAK